MSNPVNINSYKLFENIRDEDKLLFYSEKNGFLPYSITVGGLKKSLSVSNGLTNNSGTIELGGTLNKNTSIDSSSYTLTLESSFAELLVGKFNNLNTISIVKDMGSNQYDIVGLLDLTSFGGDSDTIFVGRVNFAGGNETCIQIRPTTGSIGINANTNISINPEGELSMKAGNQTNVASTMTIDITASPSTDTLALELKENQAWAAGFAALDDGSKKYSNIYYGILDSGNIITDITRVECNEDMASISANGGVNYINLENTGLLDINALRTKITLPSYANDAAADADATLPSGGLYKITGNRTVYQKP